MASTHHPNTPTVHRSTFVPPRREAREDRVSAHRAARHRRWIVLTATVCGSVGLATVAFSAVLLTR